jgi:hypothetical protein
VAHDCITKRQLESTMTITAITAHIPDSVIGQSLRPAYKNAIRASLADRLSERFPGAAIEVNAYSGQHIIETNDGFNLVDYANLDRCIARYLKNTATVRR